MSACVGGVLVSDGGGVLVRYHVSPECSVGGCVCMLVVCGHTMFDSGVDIGG